ncbi:MAG: PKD domain-containing protein [Lentisphaerae bacterium]|nr:PKD domain-containing protein [Lentisphaerota bacterium]
MDVAVLRLRHGGMVDAPANNIRIFGGNGNPLPYEVTHHDPRRDTLVSFRCVDPAGLFFVYYGKSNSPPDPMRATSASPGDGPPSPGSAAAGWIPRAGLVLATMRRPPGEPNPGTWEDMKSMMSASPGTDGAGYRANISDGMNPFGDSDFYISIYRGWVRLPSSGRYAFCTASNEGSFSFLDGNELVHWPGRHTQDRGKHGEKNKEHRLDAGLRYVEYFHEEVLLYQVAFLGCSPPNARRVKGKRQFSKIPDAWFPRPHRATVARYETPSGRTLALKATLVDNAWPDSRETGQYTRYAFAVDTGSETMDLTGWQVTWDLGDGLGALSPKAEHVYLRTGAHDVALHARGPGEQDIKIVLPLTVFPVEHLAGPFKQSALRDYRDILSSYDPALLDTPSLAEYMRALDELGGPGARRASLLLLKRTDTDTVMRGEAHVVAARETGREKSLWLREDADPEGGQHLQEAFFVFPRAEDRLRVASRLARYKGIGDLDVEGAEALFEEAKLIARKAGLGKTVKAVLRDVAVALGDVYVAALKDDKAAEMYRLAEALGAVVMPPQVRMSKSGTYPERVRQQIEKQRPEDALAELERWREELPLDLLQGTWFFLRGKTESLEGKHREAAGLLELGIRLSQGSEFESEALWLLAQARKAYGDEEGYRAALKTLVDSRMAGPWRDKALAEANP